MFVVSSPCQVTRQAPNLGTSAGAIPRATFRLRSGDYLDFTGYRQGTIARTSPSYTAYHRYFFDSGAQIYFGYDLTIQPDAQPGSYRLTFYDLSATPIDFVIDPFGAPDPSRWKRLPMPLVPRGEVLRAGESLDVTVSVDAKTGEAAVDSVTLLDTTGTIPQGVHLQPFVSVGPPPLVPTAFGDAREFSVGDAELSVQHAVFFLNGRVQSFLGAMRPISGPLLWLYVPSHGRYVLSLIPRAELGFVKGGEVRGGRVTFQTGNEQVRLECPTPVAQGDGTYVLYLFHDAEWKPTARDQGDRPLLGTVSARELAALARK